MNFEAQKGSQRGLKWSQERSKVEAKIEDQKGSSLGPCLGRFGVLLVLILGSKVIKRSLFLEPKWPRSCDVVAVALAVDVVPASVAVVVAVAVFAVAVAVAVAVVARSLEPLKFCCCSSCC